MSVRPIKSSRTRAHHTSALKSTDQLRLQIHGKYMEDIWVIIKQEVYEERLMTRMNISETPLHIKADNEMPHKKISHLPQRVRHTFRRVPPSPMH